jgi:AraC family transcriptional regulator, regulatory protein of adaptative response / methylated-DNA-[protein]-cysteine methyltransferase
MEAATTNRAPRRPVRAAFSNGVERWAAIVARRADADGRFFYAVRTTGVYCVPSCASRAPKRENVRFFTTAAAAEAAGFRPCKRCRPGQPGLLALHAQVVTRACRAIEGGQSAVGLAAMAKQAGLSVFHFHRVFKAFTGLTPKAYATAQRARRVRDELHAAGIVTRAIYAAGFGSSARFYAKPERWLGMAARDFRAGGTQAAIHFAVGACSLGQVLVAVTQRGVCAILLGDAPEDLVAELRGRFSRADLIPAGRGLEALVAQVVALVETPARGLALPLDVRGTAFQHRVWRALCEVPAGKTLSYAQLAARLNAPGSARAVAGACAANPIAVAIPCHRVVCSDGRISGYRWGVQRKRELLAREQGRED